MAAKKHTPPPKQKPLLEGVSRPTSPPPPKKSTAKRKPRQKKPVDPAVQPAEVVPPEAVDSPFVSAVLFAVPCIVSLVIGLGAGIWSAGGIEVGPGPAPQDAVSEVFDTQEAAFRKWSGERAKALRAGEIKSEAESVRWMDSKFGPDSEAAWTKLLTEEAAAFGGEQWTAEKEAATIERYAQ